MNTKKFWIPFVLCLLLVSSSFAQKNHNNAAMDQIAEASEHKGWHTFKPRTSIKANVLFRKYAAAFDLGEGFEMRQKRVSKEDKLGYTTHTFQQFYQNLLVETSYYKVHTQKGYVAKANGEIATDLSLLNIRPRLTEQQALDKALKIIDADKYAWELNNSTTTTPRPTPPKGQLLITLPLDKYNRRAPEDYVLAYKFKIYAIEPRTEKAIYIDAHTGHFLKDYPLIQSCIPQSANTLYDGTQTILASTWTFNKLPNYYTPFPNPTIPNCLKYHLYTNCMSSECGHTGGKVHTKQWNTVHDAVFEGNFTLFDGILSCKGWRNGLQQMGASAHWTGMKAYDYFYCTFDRESYDDNNSNLEIVVNKSGIRPGWSEDHKRIELTDGVFSEPLTNGPTISLDIVGHEFAHGITQHTAELERTPTEAGGLNEGFSDIFGTLVEFEYGDGDWTFGEDVWIPDGYIRSLQNPSAKSGNANMVMPSDCSNPSDGIINPYSFNDPSPDTYCGYYWGINNFDPHFTCGVLSKWFYILSQGENGVNDHNDTYNVTGIGLASAADIAYRTLTTKLGNTSNFWTTRIASIQASKELFGPVSFEVEQVCQAWSAVGVGSNVCAVNKTQTKISLKEDKDTYTPLITDKNIEWYTIDWLPYQHFYLVGDTTIDNLQYRKLYVDYIGGSPENQNVYLGGLIEIDKKIYFKTSSVKILLYDFNLIEGEQIRVRGIQEEEGVLLTVSTIDSVQLLNGEWRTRWYLDNEYGTASNDIWIEGIGSLNGVLMPGMATADVDIVVISQLQDGELVYCNPKFADVVYPGSFNKDCNALVSNTTTIDNKTNFLTATPSIFNHQTQLHFSLPKSSNISLHIFNHQGQIITSLYDKEQLQMGEYQQSLSLPNVSNGIYYAVLLVNGRRVATQKLVLIK